MKVQVTTCERCGHKQKTVVPWQYVPICKNCQKPMKDDRPDLFATIPVIQLPDGVETNDWDDLAHARNDDPGTSHAAARSMDENVAAMEQLVEEAIIRMADRDHDDGLGGATAEEVATFTGKRLNTISPRFAPLRRKGRLKVIGTRRNSTGRPAEVWAIGRDDGFLDHGGQKCPECGRLLSRRSMKARTEVVVDA
jgi:hypothetical protein